MKNSVATTGALLVATAATAAANVDVPEGVLLWDIERRASAAAVPRLRRRATSGTAETDILNDKTLFGYFVKCEIGTPAQTLTLQLDTGSSDIWVPASSASVCEASSTSSSSSSASSGCSLGSFDYESSSTFEVTGDGTFEISYVDGTHSIGDYFVDTFVIGGASLANMTMGLGLRTDIPYGLVGIGYASNEAIVSSEQSVGAEYYNLPLVMVKEGTIKTPAYSLWLNDLGASTGSLLFGGIDTAKYHGELTRLDTQLGAGDSVYTDFTVDLTSLSASSLSGSDVLVSSAFPVPAVLDSGTSLTYLPQDLAEQVWAEAGAQYDAESGAVLIECSQANSGGYFSFGFGGPGGAVVNVTMDELVLDVGAGSVCEFGVMNTTDTDFLLGDTFLRSAYVVYDLANNQIAIAPTDFNATDSNIVAFASSGAPIPSATVAPSQSDTQATATASPTYAASAGFAATGSRSGSSGGSSDSSSAGRLSATPLALLQFGFVGFAMIVGGGMLIL